MSSTPKSVAIIGSGMAGATIAHRLARNGHSVHVFDKARGPGGRLATRRIEWVDRQGQTATTRLDHGALGFTCHSAAFQSFANQALQTGRLAQWTPTVAPGSLPLDGDGTWYVPAPDMPSLCRDLMAGLPASFSVTVDGLHRGEHGWQVQADGVPHASTFDAVVLALPPAQAAPLLNPHRLDWARQASIATMQPCWTCMGITDDAEPESAWGLARPPSGPLAWVVRNDLRPGRARVPGQAHWVAHARAGWSRRHLEQPVAWVMQEMQSALADCLGPHVDWHHCTVHRWRYAVPQAHGTESGPSFWWDAARGLGVCGDFLGGGSGGVEGAWLSAQALSAALSPSPPPSDAADAPTLGLPDAAPPERPGSLPLRSPTHP